MYINSILRTSSRYKVCALWNKSHFDGALIHSHIQVHRTAQAYTPTGNKFRFAKWFYNDYQHEREHAEPRF